jgi:FkbM family methyltransferase
MALGSIVWRIRERLVGPERVVLREQVRALGRANGIGGRSHLDAQLLYLRELALGPARRARIHVAGTTLELGEGPNFPVDWKAFVEVFGVQEYRAPLRDAHVLDVGAHKGYFGAFALMCGAALVLSYEPATTNYASLERAAHPFGARWRTRHAALGSESGTGTLHLDRTSWAHSLLTVERPAGDEIVTVVTLAEALAELPPSSARLVLKVDAEGSECDILLQPSELERVDMLMVELHPKVAPCSYDEIAATLASAGLTPDPVTTGPLHFRRR